jgi:hypothetical protein
MTQLDTTKQKLTQLDTNQFFYLSEIMESALNKKSEDQNVF